MLKNQTTFLRSKKTCKNQKSLKKGGTEKIVEVCEIKGSEGHKKFRRLFRKRELREVLRFLLFVSAEKKWMHIGEKCSMSEIWSEKNLTWMPSLGKNIFLKKDMFLMKKKVWNSLDFQNCHIWITQQKKYSIFSIERRSGVNFRRWGATKTRQIENGSRDILLPRVVWGHSPSGVRGPGAQSPPPHSTHTRKPLGEIKLSSSWI